MTYSLSRHSKNQHGDQWTEFHGTGINDLQAVKAFKTQKWWSVDRVPWDRNQQLTCFQGIQKTKVVISGQNSVGQESMTYRLSRHSKHQSGDQWTEFRGTGINDLQPVKAFNEPKWWSVDRILWDRNQWLTYCQGIQNTKVVISGQSSVGQESMTYILSRHSKNQSGDWWTEFCGRGINDLQPVKAFKEPKWWSVDKILWDKNQWLTACQGIQNTKVMISGQSSVGQGSMTYILSKHSKNQSGDQWTEFRGTGINDLPPVKAFKTPKWWSVDRIPWDRNQWLTDCQGIQKTKVVISGQNSMGQESMTYRLSRHSKDQSGD